MGAEKASKMPACWCWGGLQKGRGRYPGVPAVKIITLLQERGACVCFNDPYIPVIRGMRRYPKLEMESVKLSEKTLWETDCVIVITDHSCYDYRWILENSSLIVDTRNVFKGYRSDKIVKA